MPGVNFEASTLPGVSPAMAEKYARLADALVESVNVRMGGRDDLADLIGSCHVEVMYENHRNHVAFMTCVFHW